MKARSVGSDRALSPSAIVVLRPGPARRPRVSLRLRWYLIALATAITLPLLLLATLEGVDAIDARRSEAALQMHLQLSNTTRGVTQGLGSLTALAQVLAASPALSVQDLAAFRTQAEEVASANGVDIVLRDPAGAQLVATRLPRGAPMPTLPPEDRGARAAVDHGGIFVSDVYSSGMTHPYMVRVVVPAALGSGATVATGYALEVGVPPKLISAWLDASGLPPGWVVSVVGRNGQVLAHTGDPDSYVGRGSASDVFASEDGRWQGWDLDGAALNGVWTRLPTGWVVAAGAPTWLLDRPLQLTFLRLGASAFVLIVGGSTLSVMLTRRIDRSAAALERAARALGRGQVLPQVQLPVRDLAFVQEALLGAARDLAIRRVTERDLLAEVRGARDLLQGVVDGSDDLIFARDVDNKVLLANQATAVLFGLRAGSEAVGCSLDSLLPGGATASTAPLTSTDPGVATVDGRQFEVGHSRLRDDAGKVVGTVSIARDVTERAAADARLQRLQADLARAGRLSAVAAMGAGLAHELHQPLSATANFLAVAMRRLNRLENPQPAAAAAIAAAMTEASGQVLRAGEIVQRLRGFIEAAEMQTLPLAPLVREAADAAWQHARPARARLHVQLDDTVVALVDRVSIQQVISNLVRNAAEVLGGQGGDVWVVLAPAADGSAMVSVMDSGHGIDPADTERLFDVFSGSAKKEGLGVGLAICRTIVAAHGGWITATNHAAGGAAFMFTLPVPPTALGSAPADTRRVA